MGDLTIAGEPDISKTKNPDEQQERESARSGGSNRRAGQGFKTNYEQFEDFEQSRGILPRRFYVGGQEQENGNWPLCELHVTSLKCLAVGLLQNHPPRYS